MRRRLVLPLVAFAVGVAVVAGPGAAARPGAAAGPDADLQSGIRQVQEGEFDAAIVTLDAVVRRLADEKSRAKDLSRAYMYLSVAYFGLSQEQSAKAKFLEAWKADQKLVISPSEFPPKILKFLEESRREAAAASEAAARPRPAPTPSPTATATTAAASAPERQRGGGGGRKLLIGGLVVAAAGGAAFALVPRGPLVDTFPGTVTGLSNTPHTFEVPTAGQVTIEYENFSPLSAQAYFHLCPGQLSAPIGTPCQVNHQPGSRFVVDGAGGPMTVFGHFHNNSGTTTYTIRVSRPR